MLSKLLTRKGFQIDGTEDGKEAVRIILNDTETYKLIFMDNLMPIMTG
jgi:CheY-like chemotaxis protein